MAVRVYELAKELGLESKELLSTLKGMGEFVRSASSTIEAPVVRKVKEKLATESQELGQALYASAAAENPGAAEGGATSGDNDVVDAEVVDEGSDEAAK